MYEKHLLLQANSTGLYCEMDVTEKNNIKQALKMNIYFANEIAP